MKLYYSISLIIITAINFAYSQDIKINQIGYFPKSTKQAVVPASSATEFRLISEDRKIAFTGTLSEAAYWPYSKENVQIADFTSFKKEGYYLIAVDGVGSSHQFYIKPEVNTKLTKGAIRAFYFNRASTPITSKHGKSDARKAGHPDTIVYIHSSAASKERPKGSTISSPKGWYDAGDYNKYIVNSGISTSTLLSSYEHYASLLDTLTWNIPESNNNLPDILDEVLWNLDWMLTMQDPNDGGVYHKLTTLNFSGHQVPYKSNADRYVVMKCTSAALDFAAVMAQASRVFKNFETQLPGYSKKCLDASLAAWEWAKKNPNIYYQQPEDVKTGEYGDDNVTDEFQWAATELYVTTKDDSFYNSINFDDIKAQAPDWRQVGPLSYITMFTHEADFLKKEDQKIIKEKYLTYADKLVKKYKSSAYKVVMSNFNWGSNSAALNEAYVLLAAYKYTNNKKYFEAAQSNYDYVLGKNPTGYCYVTGFGTKSPKNPHHRPSMGDYKTTPVPGFVVGGPNPAQQDNCEGYISKIPALSYSDTECSYASNEIAINWNAPLFYVSAAFTSLMKE